ncbi:TonB-dependent receptor domain-containing protein [Sphingobium tyrosinilyticum]|uniref:TonB-dependent receptor domain-containing protein n=1 Tax=Sphingobium tyrosinilyticum TaxID=2715436 RepID=A0ABV9F4X7_9SPHN
MEAGLKTQFWDRRARVNLALYRSRYSDMQIDFVASTGGNRTTAETANAPGHSTIKGVEIDAALNPVRGLTLSAAYAYTHMHLPPAPNPFNNNQVQTVYIISTPSHAGSGAIDYEVPLTSVTLRAHLDAAVSGGYRSSASEPTLTDKMFVVNGRLALSEIDLGREAGLEVALWARNLLNEQHVFYRSRGSYRFIGTYGIFNEPRTWGVDATIRF